MIFTAKYTHPDLATYYRQISADDVNEASKMAERYSNKGYICVSVKQQEGKE